MEIPPGLEAAMLDEFGTLVLDMMKNKQAIISSLLEGMEFAGQTQRLQNFVDVVTKAEEDGDPCRLRSDQLAGMVRTLSKTAMKQAKTLRDLSMIALVLVSSGDFNATCAKMANRMGKGHEAMRAMFQEKLKGR